MSKEAVEQIIIGFKSLGYETTSNQVSEMIENLKMLRKANEDMQASQVKSAFTQKSPKTMSMEGILQKDVDAFEKSMSAMENNKKKIKKWALVREDVVSKLDEKKFGFLGGKIIDPESKEALRSFKASLQGISNLSKGSSESIRQNFGTLNTVLSEITESKLPGMGKAIKSLGLSGDNNPLSNLKNIMAEMSKDTGVNKEQLDKLKSAYDDFGRVAKSRLQEVSRRMEMQSKELDRTQTMMSRLRLTFERLSAYIAIMVAFRTFYNIISKATSELNKFNDELKEIEKVSDPKMIDMGGLRSEINKISSEMGELPVVVASVTRSFIQQGLSQESALRHTVSSIKLMKNALMEQGEATNFITSMTKAYKVELSEVDKMIDKIMAVQARHAVTAEDLANGLQITASIGRQVGIEFDHLAGYITAVGVISRRSGTEVGNAFKNIFARMRRNSFEQALKDINIGAVDVDTGNLRDLQDIIGDLADKWTTLSSRQRMNIANLAGGRMRYKDFIFLMDNYREAQKAIIEQQHALGFSNDTLEISYEKLSEKLKKLDSSWTIFIQNISQASYIPVMTGIAESLTSILSGLNMATDSVSESFEKSGGSTKVFFDAARSGIGSAVGITAAITSMGLAAGVASSAIVHLLTFIRAGSGLGMFMAKIASVKIMLGFAAAVSVVATAMKLYEHYTKDATESTSKFFNGLKKDSELAKIDLKILEDALLSASSLDKIIGFERQKMSEKERIISSISDIVKEHTGIILNASDAYERLEYAINKTKNSIIETRKSNISDFAEDIMRGTDDFFRDPAKEGFGLLEHSKRFMGIRPKRDHNELRDRFYDKIMDLDSIDDAGQFAPILKDRLNELLSMREDASDFINTLEGVIKTYKELGLNHKELSETLKKFNLFKNLVDTDIRDVDIILQGTMSTVKQEVEKFNKDPNYRIPFGPDVIEGLLSLTEEFKQSNAAIRQEASNTANSVDKSFSNMVTNLIARSAALYNLFAEDIEVVIGQKGAGIVEATAQNLYNSLRRLFSNPFIAQIGIALPDGSILGGMINQLSKFVRESVLGQQTILRRDISSGVDSLLATSIKAISEMDAKAQVLSKMILDAERELKESETRYDIDSNQRKLDSLRTMAQEIELSREDIKHNAEKIRLQSQQNLVGADGVAIAEERAKVEREILDIEYQKGFITDGEYNRRKEIIEETKKLGVLQAQNNSKQKSDLKDIGDLLRHQHDMAVNNINQKYQTMSTILGAIGDDQRVIYEYKVKQNEALEEQLRLNIEQQSAAGLDVTKDLQRLEILQQSTQHMKEQAEVAVLIQDVNNQIAAIEFQKSLAANDIAAQHSLMVELLNAAGAQEEAILAVDRQRIQALMAINQEQQREVVLKLEALKAAGKLSDADFQRMLRTNSQLKELRQQYAELSQQIAHNLAKEEILPMKRSLELANQLKESLQSTFTGWLQRIPEMLKQAAQERKEAEKQIMKLTEDRAKIEKEMGMAYYSGKVDEYHKLSDAWIDINKEINNAKKEMDEINDKTNIWKSLLEDVGKSLWNSLADQIGKSLFSGFDIGGMLGGGKSQNMFGNLFGGAGQQMGGMVGQNIITAGNDMGANVLGMIGSNAGSDFGMASSQILDGVFGAFNNDFTKSFTGVSGDFISNLDGTFNKAMSNMSAMQGMGAAPSMGGMGSMGGGGGLLGGVGGYLMAGAGGYMMGKSMGKGGILGGALMGFTTGGPIGGLIGALGGLFGSRRKKKEPPPPEPEKIYPLIRNLENLTQQLTSIYSFGEGVFNPPADFTLPAMGRGIKVDGSVNVNVNITGDKSISNMSQEDKDDIIAAVQSGINGLSERTIQMSPSFNPVSMI